MSLPIDKDGVERVRHRSLVWTVDHSEHAGHLLDGAWCTRYKMPRFGVRFPDAAVLGKSVRPIVDGIKGHGQQDEVMPHLFAKTLLELPEIIGETKTEIRQGAARVDKRHRDDFSGKLRQRHLLPVLVG